MSESRRAPLPELEADRAAERRNGNFLEASSDQAFDDFALLATQVCNVPIGAITLVDEERHWFKSIVGIDGDVSPGDFTFCANELSDPERLLVVSDVLADTRFETADDLLLLHGIRFYAGLGLVDSSGRPLGAICVMDRHPRSITSHEVQALRALARQIVRLIESDRHTLALSNELALAGEVRDKATVANRAKSKFLANISHEIRTPMNGVLGVATLLKDTNLDAKQQKYVETIERSADALMGVLSNVLDFATMETQEIALQQRPVRPSEPVRAAMACVQYSAKAKGLELISAFGPEAETLRTGDSPRIQRVVEHLLNNAVKFTQAGSIAVSIERVGRDEDGLVRFSVTDTGIGIAAADLEGVFSGLERTETGLARRFGGTGLGLALSRQLVQAMGGQITVQSEPGVGSTFSFEIPMGPDLSGPAPARIEPSQELAGRKVLVADDNSVNAMVISAMLIRHGCQVKCVGDGRQAVSAVCSEPFDFVLMDIQMPVMDGLQASRAVRQLAGAAGQIPIIAITAETLLNDRNACIQAGMNDFVAKPIREATILDSIRRCLSTVPVDPKTTANPSPLPGEASAI
jgi:signal transduction histidine kinase/ActR/RegA family two-component response regulator